MPNLLRLLLTHKTGAVNALVGNVNTEGSNSFTDYNYATMSKRSPGSVIKPLIVYAPAIEAGWSIDKTVDDSPADYNGWKPTDFLIINGVDKSQCILL